MTFMLFLSQNWQNTPKINHLTGIIGNRAYMNLTPKQIDRLIQILIYS